MAEKGKGSSRCMCPVPSSVGRVQEPRMCGLYWAGKTEALGPCRTGSQEGLLWLEISSHFLPLFPKEPFPEPLLEGREFAAQLGSMHKACPTAWPEGSGLQGSLENPGLGCSVDLNKTFRSAKFCSKTPHLPCVQEQIPPASYGQVTRSGLKIIGNF